MSVCSALVVSVGCLLAGDGAPGTGSFLYQPSFCMDEILRYPAEPYVPQPGDVMLHTDDSLFWKITHDLALAFEPHNSGVIVARHDGSLAVLEAGPNDTLWVATNDLLPHLNLYNNKGPVWIRKRVCPLTPEQSARLTDFAMRQDGKRFALIRLGGQLTPLRSRGPLRTWIVGRPSGDRRGYFCSELVVECLVAAGLIDPRTARPAATYPHDLFFNHSHNPYINRHLPLEGGWHPPARWTPCP